jgi:hypothetical protein
LATVWFKPYINVAPKAAKKPKDLLLN